MKTQWFVACAFTGVLWQAIPTFAQDTSAPNGPSRQDTGISDPSVNPGQASGMRVVHGEVKQAGIKSIVIEERSGKQATISVDAATAGDRDIRPGDVITGTITAQGRAVAIHKDASRKPDESLSMSGERKGGDHGDISR